MSDQKGFRFVGLALILSLFPFSAHAASTNFGFAGAPLFVALGIAYVTRRMSIGGWLFYYYLQLYGTVLITTLLGAMIADNLQPAGWEDKALYALFVLTVVPTLLLKTIETIFATRLLVKSQRNEKNVKVVRYILLTSVVISTGSLVIDFYHFRDNLLLSIFGLVFSFLWCLYFFLSHRVDYVLSHWNGVWNYDSFKGQRIPEQEKV
jgi:hypothetical protein